jgi:hypothetical protein
VAQNIRRSTGAGESYDPKQRFVGGVVLALIMLLIYFFLQALVSLSLPSNLQTTGQNYSLGAAQVDEVMDNEEIVLDDNFIDAISPDMREFVFLGIDGKPIGRAVENDTDLVSRNPIIIGTHWRVQVASFRESGRAQRLLDELKDKGFDMEVQRLGEWYVVRSVAQSTETDAKNLERQLQRERYKPLLRKID